MPHCMNCGNSKSLASTIIPPASRVANAPPYGLLANFSEDGLIENMECQGASLEDAREAFEEPRKYFNICPECGSNRIQWLN